MTDEHNEGRGEARGIDQDLRERVAKETAIFNDALDAAMQNPASEALDKLAQAADRLMRAVGRVLIEAKRLRGREHADR